MAGGVARRRGKALEHRVAERLKGHVHVGQAGDVVVGAWVIECKYRRGYRLGRLDELKAFVEQAQANAQKQAKRRWALVLYGGRGTEYLAVLPLAWFAELIAEDEP